MRLTAYILTCTLSVANAQTIKVAFNTSPVANDLSQVAFKALQQASDMDGCTEIAGLIIQTSNGNYRFTIPVRGEKDHFSLIVKVYPGERLAALYHTHPMCDDHKTDVMFSPDDVAVARQFNIPSYIWVGFDSSMRVYLPNVSKMNYISKLHDYASYGTVLIHTECDVVPTRLSIAGTVEHTKICRNW